MKINPLPPLELLNTLLNYDPETGVFRWKQLRRNQISENSIAGCNGKNGYVSITISNKTYLAHRLAYKMHYGLDPVDLVDHIDGDRSNNCISNLRDATTSQNLRNTGLRKTNTSGFKGVSWDLKKKKWRAYIMYDGKRIHLGYYRTKEESALAYEKAAKEYYGEFARTS